MDGRFSDAGYSARQRAYEFKRFSGLYYTPQMIVNGEYQTLGHNRANAYGAINRVLKKPAKVNVSVRQVKDEDGVIAVNACALGKFENAAICVTLVENGIRRKITGGENKGRTLSMDNIVLDFQYREIPGCHRRRVSIHRKTGCQAQHERGGVRSADRQHVDSRRPRDPDPCAWPSDRVDAVALGQAPGLAAGPHVEGDHVPQSGRICFGLLDL